MDIRINGKSADIILESEETMGEFLSGIESWLESSGFSVSGIRIDGQPVNSSAVSSVFDLKLADIGEVDITASTRTELLLEALYYIRNYLQTFAEAKADTGGQPAETWGENAASRFLQTEFPDIYQTISRFFTGGDRGADQLYPFIDERIREIEDPRRELALIGQMVSEIIRRLEDLPLDIQTGKDGRAAETVTLFSAITEKIFRLFTLLYPPGNTPVSPSENAAPAAALLEEFKATLRELLAAYEAKDAVLVGDLAEYELAPRLQSLYTSLNIPTVSPA
jgi:hypothetical protein